MAIVKQQANYRLVPNQAFLHYRPVENMGGTHQHSFDFQKSAGVVSAKAFRSSANPTKPLEEQLAMALVGDSAPMQNLRRKIRMVANSAEPVLITGESGTGKELIARAIHDLSPRRNGTFLAVNCGALTESLLESELFGHVKGAFTGATTNKKGFFEAASGGTLFLDEFAEMSLSTQKRLLRVLQEGTVRPVGSTEAQEIKIDARVLVATHHDVQHDMACGYFRADLYYRINVLQIESPALRDRYEDIFRLAQHFIRKYNEKNSTSLSEQISGGVLRVLQSYSWPGNVRELENIIKRLALGASIGFVITEDDVRSLSEFRDVMSDWPNPVGIITATPSRKLNLISGGKSCRCTERLNQYQQVLDGTGGNLTAAARQLNIPRTTLRKRLVALQKRCE